VAIAGVEISKNNTALSSVVEGSTAIWLSEGTVLTAV
jgi:hypothetical protein